ncbi:MAG: PHP domain-containing protein [Chloroflexota bacterium]
MKLKLDLHTHIYEATGFRQITPEIAGRVVARIRERGLDGIAVTEHADKSYGFKVKEIMEAAYPDIVIIPGQEASVWPVQVVELYLPGDVTFRFLAHPGYPGELTSVDGLHGIEIDNPLHSWHINREKVKALAEKYNLMLFSNSDAHTVHDIGACHNEVSIEELCARARLQGSK